MNIDPAQEIVALLSSEDELGCVLRGHIHVESYIEEFIRRHLKEPDYFKNMRLEYHQKIDLALALGLDELFKSPLRFLGNLRNDFAHKLDTKLGKQEVKNFYSSFSAEAKELIHSTIQKTNKSLSKQTGKVVKNEWTDFDVKTQFSLLVISLEAGLFVELKRVRKSVV